MDTEAGAEPDTGPDSGVDTGPDSGIAPLRCLSRLCVTGVGAIALAVLVGGWVFGVEVLIRLHPGLAAMAPSTAVCFVLSAIALPLVARKRDGPSRPAALAIAGTVGVAALANLVIVYTGVATGLDAQIMPGVETFEGVAMAPATALCFILAAVALATLALVRRVRARHVAVPTVGLLAALTVLMGYAFDTRSLYEIFLFSAMALHTAVAFVLLFVAILLVHPEIGWVGVLAGRGAGSAMARYMLPIVLFGPFLLCLATLTAVEAQWFDANFRLSVLATAMMAMLGCAVLWGAMRENRSEQRITEALELTRRSLEEKRFLLHEVHHRVKNNLQQITSMIAMERTRTSDPAAVAAFGSMLGRVRALSDVHELFISSGQSATVEMGLFLERLCGSMSESMDLEHRGIALRTEAVPVQVGLDRAILIGLVVNELTTNALKHAFPDGTGGTVLIRLEQGHGGGCLLEVRDDGRGAPGDWLDSPTTTGALIVRSLVAQLRGRIETEADGGTSVRVSLPA